MQPSWRRERDSNPRYPFGYSGFQDRLFQPLTHPSAGVLLHQFTSTHERGYCRERERLALSFVAQRFNGIQLGCPVGGVVAEEDAHDNGEEAADQGDGLRNLDLPMQGVLKKKRPGKARRHSQNSAEDTDDHGLAEEL